MDLLYRMPRPAAGSTPQDVSGGRRPQPDPPPAAAVFDATGYIVAQRRATVSAKAVGRVRELRIEAGQQVRAGDVLARLDDSNSRAALELARTQLVQARAALKAARVSLAQAEPVFRSREQQRSAALISAQELDAARSTYDAALAHLASQRAAVKAARASLRVAQRAEDDMTVRAPFSGTVTGKAAQPGEIVSPLATGGFTRTAICTLVDMDSLEAEVDISERFLNRVHPGQPAAVRLSAYPDWAIPGNVVAIIPAADHSTASVKVRVSLKIRDRRILPEVGVRVSFLADDPPAAHGQDKG
jgi:RND family efflux transporter MFP subunit